MRELFRQKVSPGVLSQSDRAAVIKAVMELLNGSIVIGIKSIVNDRIQ